MLGISLNINKMKAIKILLLLNSITLLMVAIFLKYQESASYKKALWFSGVQFILFAYLEYKQSQKTKVR